MGRQSLLDLDRRDILATGDDHVLHPVPELEVAVGVQHAKVAGPEARLSAQVPKVKA